MMGDKQMEKINIKGLDFIQKRKCYPLKGGFKWKRVNQFILDGNSSIAWEFPLLHPIAL